MSYKNKKKVMCSGGVPHPTEPDLKCWGGHNTLADPHWSIKVGEDGKTRRVAWWAR